MRRLAPALVLLALAAPAAAHELQSVAMWLDETAPGRVAVTLKTPLTAEGGSAAVVPRFDDGCRVDGDARTAREDHAVLRRFTLACAGPLAGTRVRFEGLDPRMPDAVVMARFAGGAAATLAVDRHLPELVLQPTAPGPRALTAYLAIGIEHILGGTDHLLFVLGLMLAVAAGGGGTRRLVLALTAFTLAHSLTLALAVLGVWGLPPRPVEVLIALSIVMVALELAQHGARAGAGRAPTLALRQPAVVAFVFGLLHGFGFAGALTQIGLPEQARAWALLLFNLGVEIGQLAFVGALLALAALWRRQGRVALPAPGAVATALGGVATYWVLARALDWLAALSPGI